MCRGQACPVTPANGSGYRWLWMHRGLSDIRVRLPRRAFAAERSQFLSQEAQCAAPVLHPASREKGTRRAVEQLELGAKAGTKLSFAMSSSHLEPPFPRAAPWEADYLQGSGHGCKQAGRISLDRHRRRRRTFASWASQHRP